MTRTRRCLAVLVAIAFSLVSVSYHYTLSDGLLSPPSLTSLWPSQFPDSSPEQRLTGPPPQDALSSAARIYNQHNKVFGIFSRVLVVSRPSRVDRRATMERLRLALGIPWSYVDAISHDEPVVDSIIDCVKSVRSGTGTRIFEWPSNLASGSGDSDSSKPPPPSESSCFPPVPHAASTTFSSADFSSGDTPFTSHLPSFMLLTPARIACWYSHLTAIQQIADYGHLEQHSEGNQSSLRKPDDAFLILEDDVDMEQDISERLRAVWNVLPAGWDIVFLGHCWSNESHHPALVEPDALSSSAPPVALHPSFAPKCTHAYAVNPASARRLLYHLTYPPFAYSRALDQALAWLVQSNRLKAFSIVPSLVVQHKGSGSDIDEGEQGTGSRWRDPLEHSILGI
ncbi:uncharacterized protein TRAVEDRAFT_111506 [Trametes versicolor FP-101664 SS1]|uniref:uncharacterized protein n=1 Tax=Trametes versicolor (strain FP-101664) TaxID=717944 RepID=UPI0004621BE5|nr:uncharacterized protein TRAVEDRAFT_111506 [Trametes versicolor FP-101664 SS1]EIW65121.1 hypothetical protein TRAVEDRAFT_111506 [Trametes versicolor FP-101664 SS1]